VGAMTLGGHTPPTLDVAEVTVRFGGVTALEGVSLQVPPNQVAGIIGPNGAGKTTLFNAICGFVRPASGSVSYGGRPLLGTPPHRLASLRIARTLQGLGLWPGMTVLENVVEGSTVRSGFTAALLALPGAGRLERELAGSAYEILVELGIEGRANAYPGALPYGVQKKVAIARALMARPSLLLLDEPASGLSAREVEELAGLLPRLCERMSVAIVEHHLDLVMEVSHRVTVLNLGRVIASGPPEEIRRDPAVASAYLGDEVVGARLRTRAGEGGDA
jgi:branched-chain amino acid transport system ATP-binding protein